MPVGGARSLCPPVCIPYTKSVPRYHTVVMCIRAADAEPTTRRAAPSSHMSARVHCLCADSGAGKSTALAAFVALARQRGQKIGGLLGPLGDDDGLRKLASASTGEVQSLQLVAMSEQDAKQREERLKSTDAWSRADSTHSADAEAGAAAREHGVAVGPFVFDRRVFAWAQETLLNPADKDWVIIDEVGPLEMKRKEGLEPGLSRLLSSASLAAHPGCDFIVVVRPALRGKVAAHFGLPEDLVDDIGWGETGEFIDPKSLLIAHSTGNSLSWAPAVDAVFSGGPGRSRPLAAEWAPCAGVVLAAAAVAAMYIMR